MASTCASALVCFLAFVQFTFGTPQYGPDSETIGVDWEETVVSKHSTMVSSYYPGGYGSGDYGLGDYEQAIMAYPTVEARAPDAVVPVFASSTFQVVVSVPDAETVTATSIRRFTETLSQPQTLTQTVTVTVESSKPTASTTTVWVRPSPTTDADFTCSKQNRQFVDHCIEQYDDEMEKCPPVDYRCKCNSTRKLNHCFRKNCPNAAEYLDIYNHDEQVFCSVADQISGHPLPSATPGFASLSTFQTTISAVVPMCSDFNPCATPTPTTSAKGGAGRLDLPFAGILLSPLAIVAGLLL